MVVVVPSRASDCKRSKTRVSDDKASIAAATPCPLLPRARAMCDDGRGREDVPAAAVARAVNTRRLPLPLPVPPPVPVPVLANAPTRVPAPVAVPVTVPVPGPVSLSLPLRVLVRVAGLECGRCRW